MPNRLLIALYLVAGLLHMGPPFFHTSVIRLLPEKDIMTLMMLALGIIINTQDESPLTTLCLSVFVLFSVIFLFDLSR